LSFEHLGLIEPILKALKLKGYEHPTTIQQQSIPLILARKDILGCAQTGTGKTAAFAIPILQLLSSRRPGEPAQKRPLKALVLTPTRELAIQVEQSFEAYGKFSGLRHLVIFGGVSQEPQVNALRKGVDILIATPGRLLDLYDQHFISLREIEFLVLDEADRMLDMGFVHDVKKIIQKIPTTRQTLFFSATMPPEIKKLSASILKNPSHVEASPVSSTASLVEQSMYFVDKGNKKSLLIHLLSDSAQQIDSVLVFTRTKHGADRVTKDLNRAGISAEAIHGNKSQNARQRALHNFKSKQTRVLVATDIAARGIDIKELAHVINYELPNIPETYVHRIGRTGRAGSSGLAFSFCDHEEKAYLKDIHRLLEGAIPVVHDHPFMSGAKGGIAQERVAQTAGAGHPERSRKFSPVVRRPSPRRVISPNTFNAAN
jgi:ATP-dependent RNA helicase RhlE